MATRSRRSPEIELSLTEHQHRLQGGNRAADNAGLRIGRYTDTKLEALRQQAVEAAELGAPAH
jgi:hypothetical protein